MDLALYIWRLGSALGFKSPSGLVGYLIVSGLALTYLRAPVSILAPLIMYYYPVFSLQMGRLTAKEQQLEGEFRYVNSRLIANAEEVAFYKVRLRIWNGVEESV